MYAFVFWVIYFGVVELVNHFAVLAVWQQLQLLRRFAWVLDGIRYQVEHMPVHPLDIVSGKQISLICVVQVENTLLLPVVYMYG
jgi:hypothetical protein